MIKAIMKMKLIIVIQILLSSLPCYLLIDTIEKNPLPNYTPFVILTAIVWIIFNVLADIQYWQDSPWLHK